MYNCTKVNKYFKNIVIIFKSIDVLLCINVYINRPVKKKNKIFSALYLIYRSAPSYFSLLTHCELNVLILK